MYAFNFIKIVKENYQVVSLPQIFKQGNKS